jgi:hypothetical protein
MGLRVNPQLEYDEEYYQTDQPRYPTGRAARIRAWRRPRRMLDEDE